MKFSDRFLNWIEFVFRWEGEYYENDPDDAGGETKFGIDKRSHPEEDIRHLTAQRAREIYHDDYWLKVRADDLPMGIGEIVADIAVNSGVNRASRWLQRIVGTSEDGIIGPMTITATVMRNKHAVEEALLDRRDEFYVSIARGSQAKYLRGWLNRNRDLRRLVQNLNTSHSRQE